MWAGGRSAGSPGALSAHPGHQPAPRALPPTVQAPRYSRTSVPQLAYHAWCRTTSRARNTACGRGGMRAGRHQAVRPPPAGAAPPEAWVQQRSCRAARRHGAVGLSRLSRLGGRARLQAHAVRAVRVGQVARGVDLMWPAVGRRAGGRAGTHLSFTGRAVARTPPQARPPAAQRRVRRRNSQQAGRPPAPASHAGEQLITPLSPEALKELGHDRHILLLQRRLHHLACRAAAHSSAAAAAAAGAAGLTCRRLAAGRRAQMHAAHDSGRKAQPARHPTHPPTHPPSVFM